MRSFINRQMSKGKNVDSGEAEGNEESLTLPSLVIQEEEQDSFRTAVDQSSEEFQWQQQFQEFLNWKRLQEGRTTGEVGIICDDKADANDSVHSLQLKVEELEKLVKDLRKRVAWTKNEGGSRESLGLIPEDAMGKKLSNIGTEESTREAEKEQLVSQSENRWKKLHVTYRDSFDHGLGQESSIEGFSKKSSLVFMHPEDVREGRNYTDEELAKVIERPFPSRIFISNVQIEWNTVWLRTRHTDHHAHQTSFIQIRDALKADFITNNPLGAKYALTELFNMCYGMDKSDYCSFACTLASALSEGARNTEFSKCLLEHVQQKTKLEAGMEELQNIHPMMSKTELQVMVLQREQAKARKRLLQLMDIVFSKLRQKQLLVDDNKNNIYRVVMCMTHYNRVKFPFFYATFSFLFQVTAAVYVVLSLTSLGADKSILDWKWDLFGQNVAMALGTFFYGIMTSYTEMSSSFEVFLHFYRRERSLLATMDAIVNIFFPLVITIIGFFVVLQQDEFIECVFNSVALVFITEIDDHLPKLLDLDVPDIVQGFLIDQALHEYEHQNIEKEIHPIQFSDMHITNTEESGSRPSKGVTFQPYEVFSKGAFGTQQSSIDYTPSLLGSQQSHQSRKKSLKRDHLRDGDDGHQIANKRSVTKDCLLKKISWQYTEGFNNTSQPRIGHLKLEKLTGSHNVIDIIGKQKAKDEANKQWYSVSGVYIITSFSMSDDILRLRICGSNGAEAPENFVRAFDYYNLWPLHSEARKILSNLAGEDPKEIFSGERVLYGSNEPPSKKSEHMDIVFSPNTK